MDLINIFPNNIWQGKFGSKMKIKAARREYLLANLVLRQSIVDLNNTLARKVLGQNAKSHYPTLLSVKAHIAKDEEQEVY